MSSKRAIPEKQLWKKLMAAWNAGHRASLCELATRYTKNYPDNVWGWVTLSDSLVHFANYKAAHAAMTRADKLAPPNIRRHICVQWGHLYNESCDLKKAEKWYRRAVELKPTTTGLTFLGAVLAKQGRLSEAKQCHRRAVRLATDPVDEAYYNLGLIFRAEGRYTKALECFKMAIKIDPDYTYAKEAHKDVSRALKLKRNR